MKKELVVMILIFCFTGIFGGARDIEDENYVMVLGIDENAQGGYVLTYLYQDGTKEEKKVLSLKGDDFTEIEKQYNKMAYKNLELGHIKAVLIGESLLQEDKKNKMLEELLKEDIPYLCYVYQAADAKEILEKEASEPFGLTTLLYQGFVGEKKKERVQLVDLFADGEDEKEAPLVRLDEKGIKADISVNP
ncbi:MAG: hypothetical protein IJA10_00010 [Lachnospiraceae bacterium]|nr:hypothetical protein [Lachnospiraceae bacterium]